MLRAPPRSTRTDTLFPDPPPFQSRATEQQAPSEVLNALPNGGSTPEIKVDAPNGDPHAFVERFVAQSHFDDARLSTIDGLRVDWPDGWGLVRASNTTPVLYDLESDYAQQQPFRSEEHTSELQSLMRLSYAVFCLKKKT